MGVAVNVERLGRRIAAFEIGPRLKTRLAECERPFVLVGVEKNAAHGIDLIAPHLIEWPVLIFFAGCAGSDGLDDGSQLPVADFVNFAEDLVFGVSDDLHDEFSGFSVEHGFLLISDFVLKGR